MKIHFDNVSFSARTGPNTFAKRLAHQFIIDGHEVVVGSSADVSLVFIEPSGEKLANRVIQRLDGIWFKPEEFDVKNVQIRELYHAADSVVFQSQFDLLMAKKWFGDAKRNAVIPNGIHINPIKSADDIIPEILKLRSSYDVIYCCSANWHPQKRLRSNLELFDQLRKSTPSKTCCMIVMGSNPDVLTSDPHVYYTGSLPHELCLQVFAISDWMIHLAWADHCPNTVIESISQNTPVICSPVGGTKELIEGFGVVIEEPTYNFELADYDNPPPVDVRQLTTLPEKSSLMNPILSKIDIKETARAYIETFKDIL